MHKLMEYICDQMEEYEQKVAKDGKLSMAEIEYVDKLAHIKKNLLKAEEMWNDSEYSMAGDGSYARGDSSMRGRSNARRSYGRNQYGSYAEGYSMAEEDISEELKDLMHSTSDHQTKQDIQRMINRMR